MDSKHEDFRTIWLSPNDPGVVQVIDQRRLPHEYHVLDLCTWSDGCRAIADMAVRGAIEVTPYRFVLTQCLREARRELRGHDGRCCASASRSQFAP